MQGLSRKEVQIAYIKDVKPAGTNGGTPVALTWNVRDLNTLELSNPAINWVSLGVNQFTLQPGVYEIFAVCPTLNAQQNQARLYNTTDSVVAILGPGAYDANTGQNSQDESFIMGTLKLTAAKVFQVQHNVIQGFALAGFGIDTGSLWTPTNNNIYTQVKIKRIGD